MGIINLDYDMTVLSDNHKHLSLSMPEFQRFNASILGLGDIAKQDERIDALAAIFDLEGFTAFCNQTDPQLVVPEYLDELLYWLFRRISKNFCKTASRSRAVLWGKFPFFAKFLGDGILFLWDTTGLGPASLGNIIINLYKTSNAYRDEFLPHAKKSFAKLPSKLRCGVARGEVIPIGGGKDFVGSCLNIAARLQKTGQLSFAFSRKGFDPAECFGKVWRSQFITKRITVRGIGEDELVLICKTEFDALAKEEKELFRDP